MINSRGLIGEKQITFHQDIRRTIPQDKISIALLGCAVLYKGEELYITQVLNISNYFNILSFKLSNGVTVNQSEVRFFVSDENDDTENSHIRINSIEMEYNLYKDFNTRLEPTDGRFLLKTNYDALVAEDLRNELSKETEKYTNYYHKAQEGFLSIINSLKYVIVKVTAGETGKASIITTIQDYAYTSRIPNVNVDDVMTIKFNYDDILIKINGNFLPVTAKNLIFIYNNKHLTFKELLEMHNNKEIKYTMGVLPK